MNSLFCYDESNQYAISDFSFEQIFCHTSHICVLHAYLVLHEYVFYDYLGCLRVKTPFHTDHMRLLNLYDHVSYASIELGCHQQRLFDTLYTQQV